MKSVCVVAVYTVCVVAVYTVCVVDVYTVCVVAVCTVCNKYGLYIVAVVVLVRYKINEDK